jgi:hypothetical protein
MRAQLCVTRVVYVITGNGPTPHQPTVGILQSNSLGYVRIEPQITDNTRQVTTRDDSSLHKPHDESLWEFCEVTQDAYA